MLPVFVVLLLGCVEFLHAGPLASEPAFQTQENFDLNRLLGKWYDIASASDCPWRRKHKTHSLVGSLELQRSDSPNTLDMTRTMSRQGVCKVITGSYELTETPGRFYYHSVKWSADVDAYVVHTNYDEYALVIMLQQQRHGNKTTSVKLYGRQRELRPTLIEDFKTLVAEQGMSADTISIKENKGDCVPGQQTNTPPETKPRARRTAALPTVEEGSGDDMPVFRGAESCTAKQDTGPCFGMFQRFSYNSSLMACQQFVYGGCMGNQNNFETEKECLQTCRTEAACRLPMDPGPCNAALELWAFDAATGKCVAFKYGGCNGNGNKFYSQKECEEYCGVTRDGDEEFLKVN
ncbi:protein AMBP [Electrophorus electricus]|uniref:Protein AMBP n=1 Tax=Electrophorus electricus TaxID=8005 RepID=A0A4W4FB60_ELEEL|nr:protein AMBP [Electrophorus electricus]